jgi:glycosyltransferase involved in cell wall biosynthesis
VRISVVVPVHNGERYLGEALDSILSGSTAPAEIIVVDDGSSDGSAQVAGRFAGVRCVRQPATGAASARNHGLTLCKGEAVAFLDADDLWTADKLELQVAALQQNPSMDGVFGSVVQFRQQGERRLEETPKAGQLLGSWLVRRQVFERVGPFNEGYRMGEFIDWCLRSQELGCRYLTIPEVVLRRRLHEHNMGRTERENRQDYARIVMAALRRRKASPACLDDSDCARSD